jgi:hypothetical protein
VSPDSVAGAVQFFRRECFDEIGGYRPLRYGGIDAAAEIMTRMHGWEVATMFDAPVLHHRRVAADGRGIIKARFRQGRMFRALGYHPVFEVFRCMTRLRQRPYGIGALAELSGFVVAAATGDAPDLPGPVVSFLRREQLRKLKSLVLLERA